jgi:hypothetical protein
MKHACWLSITLLLSPIAQSQQIEKVQPAKLVRDALVSKPFGLAREVRNTAMDFVTFRNPQSSVLTIAQIGAASADAVTSLNNLHSCPSCTESGPSTIFVGRHPDAHKYIIAGVIEIGVEAVAAHYFRNRGPKQRLYWKILWEMPQSLSLYGHTRAARHNAALDVQCFSTPSYCN